jgi:hypothetical protein
MEYMTSLTQPKEKPQISDLDNEKEANKKLTKLAEASIKNGFFK